MGEESIVYIKNATEHGLDYIPDGAIKYSQLNYESFSADLKVDDCRDLEYHRSNGISKNKEVKFYEEGSKYIIETQFTQAYGLLHIIHIATSSFF